MSKEEQTNHERVFKILSHMPLFASLAPDELQPIAKETREVKVKRGELIVRHGQPCTGFFYIIHGRVKITKTSPEGIERVIRIFGQGQSFGEAIMFMGSDYIVSVTALSETAVLHIGKDKLFEQLETDPKIAHKMLGSMSRRMHSLIKDIESYTLFTGAQRLIGYILWQNEIEHSDTFQLGTSKSVVASRLNLTPEHFSRILRELSDKGLIRVQGREFTILDVEGLRAYTG